MKKNILFLFFIMLSPIIAGQEAGKISGTEKNAINKIGTIPLESIGNIASIHVQHYYKNCKEILLNNPSSPDGIYTIDPDGQGGLEPFNCYCDMTTDGGGWTMAGYYKQPATENAPDDLDNRDYAYFMKARNNEAYGRPEFIANPDSEGAWTDWRILSGVTWPVEFAVILDQQPWSTGWDDYRAKVIYRVKNRNIMPNYGTEQDLTTGDNLYYKWYFTQGWTDVGSSSMSLAFAWYPYAGSQKYLILFHESNYKYVDGSEPTNYQRGAYYGGGVPGGNDTWYHSARMLIR